jgi:hypothetical protein
VLRPNNTQTRFCLVPCRPLNQGSGKKSENLFRSLFTEQHRRVGPLNLNMRWGWFVRRKFWRNRHILRITVIESLLVEGLPISNHGSARFSFFCAARGIFSGTNCSSLQPLTVIQETRHLLCIWKVHWMSAYWRFPPSNHGSARFSFFCAARGIFSGTNCSSLQPLTVFQQTPRLLCIWKQDRPLGGASGALALGADFEGAPKRQSPTGHALIRSTVAWWFPHLQTKRVANDFLKFGCIGFSLFWLFWCLHMYIHVMLYVYCWKYCWLPP